MRGARSGAAAAEGIGEAAAAVVGVEGGEGCMSAYYSSHLYVVSVLLLQPLLLLVPQERLLLKVP